MQNRLSKFYKIMKTNLDIINDVTYKHKKKSTRNSLFRGLHKNEKSDKICRYEYMHSDLDVCDFGVAQEYRAFKIVILLVCGINSWLHPNMFFLLFRTHKCDFSLDHCERVWFILYSFSYGSAYL
jgi:hypothetical protein